MSYNLTLIKIIVCIFCFFSSSHIKAQTIKSSKAIDDGYTIYNVPINCGGINQTIPIYIQDTGKSFSAIDNRYLLRNGIILPITKSKAEMEIRMWIYGGHQKLLDISCSNDSINVDRYVTFVGLAKDSSKIMSDGYYIMKNKSDSVFAHNKDEYLNPVIYFKKYSHIVLKSSWNDFFKDLIHNHLYDLPDQATLDKMVLEYNPKAAINREGEVTFFELKNGKYYRKLVEQNDYASIPSTAFLLKCKQNLFDLFSQFYKN